ncbi:proteolipid protein 2-like [Clupea harengus]|uniref:Proteolipid protein 2-like n=1 Tax=Clupea harengus TaxID=7950 RepID=A0A6P8F9T3_CLUHA|nr:proteolipid protein 2-like [Clupea harengus]
MMAEPEGRVDMSINYLKTRKGMTMAGEIVLCLFSIVGKTVPVNVGCYIIVPLAEIVLGIFMLIIFTRGLEKTSFEVHWLFCDLLRAVTGSVILLMTSANCFIHLIAKSAALITGEVFGLCAGCLFGYDVFLVYSMIKSKNMSTTDEVPPGQEEQS